MNEDARFRTNLDGCPDKLPLWRFGSDDRKDRSDQVVQIEPVTASAPGTDDEPESDSAHPDNTRRPDSVSPVALSAGQEESRLSSDEHIRDDGRRRWQSQPRPLI